MNLRETRPIGFARASAREATFGFRLPGRSFAVAMDPGTAGGAPLKQGRATGRCGVFNPSPGVHSPGPATGSRSFR